MALGGRTIAEWQSTMTQREFESWRAHFINEPFDDRHRYHRPAALIASMTGKTIEADKAMEWLCPEPTFRDLSAADVATIRAFGFARKGEGT